MFFPFTILSIAGGMELKCQVDLISFEGVRGFWGLTCVFWAGFEEEKIAMDLMAIESMIWTWEGARGRRHATGGVLCRVAALGWQLKSSKRACKVLESRRSARCSSRTFWTQLFWWRRRAGLSLRMWGVVGRKRRLYFSTGCGRGVLRGNGLGFAA